ncbi:ATP synthase F0F1 subunit alpha [Bacillus gaemokensis]|uniref:ATP synthase F0F1 subunit alpha n=1 Tax=Bacillus gaemokensis TaxID=574375 RepID=A0A073KNT7_9BACI|nr:ATP synthase F0F1 subunit alpha [Bacillus gaemokensis]KEK24028.1 ATP synthase F0F1 subunit alpha [Bacillus gaemokensis]KYG27233.1 ATP synthase F0F1 subunit alpha [Bacillus gaemokensis]
MNMKKVVLAGALGFAALAGTNLPGLEVTKASAASVESNTTTIEGRVVEVTENAFYIESKEYNDNLDNLVRIEVDFNPNVKVGDQVKATGFMWRNFSTFMTATTVEQVQDNKSLTPGIHYDKQGKPDFAIGTITKQYKFTYDTNESQDFVIVTYPNKEGKALTVHVALSSNNKFNVGDTVKVKNILEWIRSDHFETDEINMEKMNETKTPTVQDDRWIWS